MITKSLVHFFLGLMLPVVAVAQVDTTAVDSLPPTSAPDTLVTTQPDTLQSDSVKVLFKVRPWQYHSPLLADTAAPDSTLRWQLWPSWTYKKNRDPGVISYRMGSIGRTNTQQVYAHAPKYQQLYWEDIELNSPVSGIANWNYIPHHKIEKLYESDLGTVHRTKFFLKEYYLNEPLTRLNYTESSFDFRNLEFVVSQNFSQRTNAELSYWLRRGGGEYNNSAVSGQQIYARVSHQLDARQALKAKFLNNKYDNGLPFGYLINDPEAFAFDRFTTNAVEPGGQGSRSSNIIGLNYYRRPADSTDNTSKLHAGIFTNAVKREVSYSADTTSYNVSELGANVRKWLEIGPLAAEGAASVDYFINKNESQSSLQTDNWAQFSTEAKIQFQPVSFLGLKGHGNYSARSDGYADYRLAASADFSVGNRVSVSAGLATGSLMPTPQQLYWQADEFAGHSELEKEQIQEMHGKLEVAAFDGSTVGIKTQLKQIENGIMVGTDSVFTNVNPYSSLATAAYFDYQSTHFEFSGSATVQQFGNFLTSRSQQLPVNEDQRIWLKGSAYVKGYLFSRATYVKFGLFGVVSPQAYKSARYYPSLDFWQSRAGSGFVPSFSRLDVDLSARIRSIMVLLRYENVLDEVVQQGYFETADYPMTRRRFIFGIRVLFRN